MPKIDQALWRNPFTPTGLRLPAERDYGGFQIHESGSMTLQEDWQYQDVSSPFWRLFYEFSEGAWVQSAGEEYQLNRECVVILPAGVPFDCGCKAGVRHIWLHFSLPLNLSPNSLRVFKVPAGLEFQTVAKVFRLATMAGDVSRSQHLGSALLHIVFAAISDDVWRVTDRRLQRVLSWLEHNIGSEVNNETLAAQAGLGVESFIRWFRGRTQRTPGVYVSELRVQEACRRLAYEDDSIEVIAESVGYSNRHHFSRVFKQYAGMGPATFRRDYRNR